MLLGFSDRFELGLRLGTRAGLRLGRLLGFSEGFELGLMLGIKRLKLGLPMGLSDRVAGFQLFALELLALYC
jgi:hypothetical protein